MVIVTFRNSVDQLTSMFTARYRSVEQAKAAIFRDAMFFLDQHDHVSKHDAYTNTRRKVSHGWKKPKTLDYFEAKAKDGTSCIWQYFTI